MNSKGGFAFLFAFYNHPMNKKSLAELSAVILGGIILIFLAFVCSVLRLYKNYESIRIDHEKYLSDLLRPEQEESEESLNIPSDWKIYRNQKYGFEIGYPENWPAPKESLPQNINEEYELKISFKNNPIKISNVSARKLLASKSKNYQDEKKIGNFDLGVKYSEISDPSNSVKISRNSRKDISPEIEKDKGFDVFIYSLTKLPTSSKNSIPVNKKYSLETTYNFNNPNASIANPSQCYSERISLAKDSFYFKKAYFYNVSHEKYAFNIVPYYNGKNDNKIQSDDIFPEFYQSLFSFGFRQELPPILEPRFKRKTFVTRGTIKCVHGGKPQMSKTKGRHMDEDCCPDPDEWPKPGCAYSAKDYAIMLSGPPKSKLAKGKK